MTGLIAFTLATEDDFWQSQAYSLRENLKKFGLELIIGKMACARATCDITYSDAYAQKNETFFDFASQEKNRILFLDAEVRMHRHLPQQWLNDHRSVLFEVKPLRKNLWHNRSNNTIIYLNDPTINTGQGIWNKAGVDAFKKGAEWARTQDITDFCWYPPACPEPWITQFIDDYIPAVLSSERVQLPDAEASRGIWVSESTIFTHPELHRLEILRNSGNTIGKKRFLNHYQYDLANGLKICEQMKTVSSWDPVDIKLDLLENYGYVFPLNQRPPENLSPSIKRRNFFCYSSGGWIFCPMIGFLSPCDLWDKFAMEFDKDVDD